MFDRRKLMRGSYAVLSSKYNEDDAIDEAGPLAELLFVRGLAYCSERWATEGFIPERQLDIVGRHLDDPSGLAKRLVEVGLWERDDERRGFQIRSWLDWNPSAEQIDAYRAKDRARKQRSRDDRRSANGQRADSDGSPRGIREESVTSSTSTSTSTGTPSVPYGNGRTESPASSADLATRAAELRDAARYGRKR